VRAHRRRLRPRAGGCSPALRGRVHARTVPAVGSRDPGPGYGASGVPRGGRAQPLVNPPADPIAVALEAAGALEALGIRYTIGGSIASSIAGEPRSTVDIDIVAALEETHARPLAALL